MKDTVEIQQNRNKTEASLSEQAMFSLTAKKNKSAMKNSAKEEMVFPGV